MQVGRIAPMKEARFRKYGGRLTFVVRWRLGQEWRARRAVREWAMSKTIDFDHYDMRLMFHLHPALMVGITAGERVVYFSQP